MGFKCGIVGLPNVGKSLLFNLLTKSQAARSENFAFCTIEPNIAKVPFMDKNLTALSKKTGSKKTIYSFLEFFDIAGLVPKASAGEGLGNKFLSHISQVDSIVMLLRCFDEDDVAHYFDDIDPENKIDPIRDLGAIKLELQCYDMNLLQKHLLKCKDSTERKKIEGLIDDLEKDRKITSDSKMGLLSSKPMIVVCNGTDKYGVKEHCKEKNIPIIEMPLFDLNDDVIDKFIKMNFDLLDLITYFTTGPEETRSWTISRGTNAQDAAGKIHGDFVKGFIRAEVSSYEKYMNGQSRPQVQGKSYIVQDMDIIEFKINPRK